MHTYVLTYLKKKFRCLPLFTCYPSFHPHSSFTFTGAVIVFLSMKRRATAAPMSELVRASNEWKCLKRKEKITGSVKRTHVKGTCVGTHNVRERA